MLSSYVWCWLYFRFKDVIDCELITVKAFNSSYTVSSYRLAKLSEGFYKEKLAMERKQTELLESMSKQNTTLDGVYCLILSIWKIWYWLVVAEHVCHLATGMPLFIVVNQFIVLAYHFCCCTWRCWLTEMNASRWCQVSSQKKQVASKQRLSE